MEYLLVIVIGTLVLIILALLIRIWLLRKSVRGITEMFQDRLTTETNTLIDVSSRDPYILKLASDINCQLRLLRTERHRFQQGDRELKEAITNLSHDLRTPLTAINGYLDLLEQEKKSETVNRYLYCIRNRTEALKNLTEELFCYSMVTSEQTMKIEPVNLVRVLEESLVSFYGVMKERGNMPEIIIPETPVWRDLDCAAVNRIFSNIISNALKYTDGDFSVSMEEDGIITFTNKTDDLDAVTVGRLFDRFYTVETGSNSTGLGLAIAKILTERMGGSIEAVYEQGRLRLILSF